MSFTHIGEDLTVILALARARSGHRFGSVEREVEIMRVAITRYPGSYDASEEELDELLFKGLESEARRLERLVEQNLGTDFALKKGEELARLRERIAELPAPVERPRGESVILFRFAD